MKESRADIDIRVVKNYGLARICKVKFNEKEFYTPCFIDDIGINILKYIPRIPATLRFLSKEINECLTHESKDILMIKFHEDFDSKIFEKHEPKMIIIPDGYIITKKSRKFIEFMLKIREEISFETLIYLSFTPLELIPILCYLGIDLFDTYELRIQAYKGKILLNNNYFKLSNLSEIPCKCDVCRNKNISEIKPEDIISHGINTIRELLINIRENIRMGTFREFLEYICSYNTKLMEYLRIIDNEKYNIFEKYVNLY